MHTVKLFKDLLFNANDQIQHLLAVIPLYCVQGFQELLPLTIQLNIFHTVKWSNSFISKLSNLNGVMVKAMDCGIVESEFVL